MKRFSFWFKISGYILLCLLLLILILQNSQAVDFKFLGFYFSFPLVFLLLISVLIGFLLGILTLFIIYPRGKKEEVKKEKNV
ncbi:MAG: LapA family protein [Brevinematia bacterium]